jgi:hypothetical protein
MNHYQQKIRESLTRTGHVGAADPRHVEAWMRLEHGCLDGLSRQQFTEEVAIALQCVAAATTADSEALATSMGL